MNSCNSSLWDTGPKGGSIVCAWRMRYTLWLLVFSSWGNTFYCRLLWAYPSIIDDHTITLEDHLYWDWGSVLCDREYPRTTGVFHFEVIVFHKKRLLENKMVVLLFIVMQLDIISHVHSFNVTWSSLRSKYKNSIVCSTARLAHNKEKLRVISPLRRDVQVTYIFPSQEDNNEESVSMFWYHRERCITPRYQSQATPVSFAWRIYSQYSLYTPYVHITNSIHQSVPEWLRNCEFYSEL